MPVLFFIQNRLSFRAPSEVLTKINTNKNIQLLNTKTFITSKGGNGSLRNIGHICKFTRY